TTFTTSAGFAGGFEDWSNRVAVTVQHGQVGGALTDFPVYVDLSDMPAGFWSAVNSDCGDIRVTESDGTTEVPREVAACNTGGDTGELYFKAPALSSSSDSTFYIYYGDSGASDYATSATYGAQNVWTNGYKSVYHFEQDPSGTVLDSTANHFDLAGSNMDSSNEVAGAVAGNGYSFNGVDEQLSDTSEVWPNSDDQITVQFWNNITAAASAE